MSRKAKVGWVERSEIQRLVDFKWSKCIFLLLILLIACDESDQQETVSIEVSAFFKPDGLPHSITKIAAQAYTADTGEIFSGLTIQNGIATGTLALPIGQNISVTVKAYKEYSLLFTGSQVADTATSMTSSLEIYLQPTALLEDMVLIPAGEFTMGDYHDTEREDEKPVHTVHLDEFYIDKYEVTNAQYAQFLNQYGKDTDAVGHRFIEMNCKHCKVEKIGDAYEAKLGYAKHPVRVVSWFGAAAYAQFYDKRLPTEAEWEKAARGGLVGKMYSWGDELTHSNANYLLIGDIDHWITTAPVGIFPPNGYGIYDTTGNVLEWCADEYTKYYYSGGPGHNPKGPGEIILFVNDDFVYIDGETWRVVRGGDYNDDESFGHLRVAARSSGRARDTFINVGFRCAR